MTIFWPPPHQELQDIPDLCERSRDANEQLEIQGLDAPSEPRGFLLSCEEIESALGEGV